MRLGWRGGCACLSGIALVGSACLDHAPHCGIDGGTLDVVVDARSFTILKNKRDTDTTNLCARTPPPADPRKGLPTAAAIEMPNRA